MPGFWKKNKMEFIVGNEKRLIEFVSNLDAKDKVAVISHNDGDGVCSALITKKLVGEIDSIDFIGYSFDMLDKFPEKFKKLKIKKIIITDLAVDEQADKIKEMEKFADILIMDHHPVIADLNSEKTIMLKTKSELPASYVCYKLFSKFSEIPSWMGILGTLLDTMHKYTEENMGAFFKDYEFDSVRTDHREKAILLSNALIYFRDNLNKVFDLLKEVKDFDDLDVLAIYSDQIEKEIQKWLEDFKENRIKKGDIYFYYFNPQFPVTSAVSNILSLQEKDMTYVFVTKRRNMLNVSSRSQNGKMNCPELLKKAIKNIPNSTAGGHDRAAGAKLPAKYFDLFKESLFEGL